MAVDNIACYAGRTNSVTSASNNCRQQYKETLRGRRDPEKFPD